MAPSKRFPTTSGSPGGQAPMVGNAVETWKKLFSILPKDLKEQCIKDNMTSKDVVDNLKEQGAAWNSSRAQRLNNFIRSVSPFFNALDVFVSVDPLHAATIWGALRVVIQLGFGYVQFLDKFTTSLDSIAEEMQYFTKLKDLFSDHKSLSFQRLHELLEAVFMELSDFLLGVFRMFYHPDGKSKSVIRVLTSTTLKPFAIDRTLQALSRHRASLLEVFVLLDLFKSEEAKSAAEEEHKKAATARERAGAVGEKTLFSLDRLAEVVIRESEYAFVQRARSWLAPPDFDDRFRDAVALREAGTTGWLLQHEVYQAWVSSTADETARNLRVKGNPGSGKTVLAASVVEDLQNRMHDLPVCYFFFNSISKQADAGQSNNCPAAYRAIVSQLLQKNFKNERLKELLLFAMHYQSSGQLRASNAEITDLAGLALGCVDGAYIVLDALDECESCEELLANLRKTAEISGVRLALFSRPTITDLPKQIRGVVSLTIGCHNESDINIYLLNAIVSLREKGLLSARSKPELVADTLTKRADGMFLWARLIIAYLHSPALYPAERQQVIADVRAPEGLDVMFERIVRLIERSDGAMRTVARRSFLWLLYGQRPMLPDELETAFMPAATSGEDDDPAAWKLPDFEDTVVRACSGFVERDPRQTTYGGRSFRPFRLIHAAVKEYLVSASQSPADASRPSPLRNEILPPARAEAHAEMATICLRYMTWRMPAQPLSGRLGTAALAADLWSAWPLSNYAALSWTTHLSATHEDGHAVVRQQSFYDAVAAFLRQPKVLMAWIECCYTYSCQPERGHLQNWGAQVAESVELESPGKNKKVAANAYELGLYLERLEQDWGDRLRETPSIVWEEATVFNPSNLLLKHGGIQVRSMQCQPPPTFSHAPINRVSQVAPDEENDVVLSVYPSEPFYHHMTTSGAIHPERIVDDKTLSQGWIARYEVVSIKTCTSVAVLDIPLPPLEVWLRACETYTGNAMQVSISLSRDCRFLSVMRMVYHVWLLPNGIMGYVSHALPTESSARMDEKVREKERQGTKITFADFPRFRKENFRCMPLYWIYFEDEGRHLCYVEQQRSHPTIFKVYSIDVREGLRGDGRPPRLGTSFIAERKTFTRDVGMRYTSAQAEKEFELCFHPREPAVIYASSQATYMWNFSNETAARLDHGCRNLIRITCSITGDSCILESRGTLPRVVRIPVSMHNNSETDRGEEAPSTQGRTPNENFQLEDAEPPMYVSSLLKSADVPSIRQEPLAYRVLGRPKTLTGSNLLVGPDKQHNHVSVTSNGAETVLTHWDGGETRDSLVLTRLPNWSGSATANVSVIRPAHKDEPLRVVLDTAANSWSKLQLCGEGSYPLVVERHLLSLGKPASPALRFLLPPPVGAGVGGGAPEAARSALQRPGAGTGLDPGASRDMNGGWVTEPMDSEELD